MAADLIARGPHPVVLRGGETASGLADMLHQYLEQSLVELPGKVHQARRLAGAVHVRVVEDPALCVRIAFAPDGIEIADTTEATPSITGDFLTIAHLTAGQESPLALWWSRRLRASFRVAQLLFLVRVLWFMQTPGAERRLRRRALLGGALVVVAVVALGLVFAA